MGLVLLTGPAEPVLSLDEVRTQVNSTIAADAGILTSCVAAATARAEAFTGRRFVSQSWRLTRDAFPGSRVRGWQRIQLPHPPLVSVASVKYVDENGVLQTWGSSNYVVRTGEAFGEIVRAYDVDWPSARSEADAVRVEFTCGYGDAADVPDAIKRAVALIAGTLYANRETVAPVAMQPIPHSAEWLLEPYRVVRFGG